MVLDGGGGEKTRGDFTWRRNAEVQRGHLSAGPQATPIPITHYCVPTLELPSVLGAE